QFSAKSVYKTAPVLICEILSPSTRQIDRREKLVAYRKLESLRHYVIIHQNKTLLEVYTKESDGEWQVSSLARDDELRLELLPGSPLIIPVSDVYEQVDPPFVVEESEEDYEILAT